MARPAALILALLLAGCVRGGDERTGAEERDAELRFVTGDAHKTLDPQKISWVSDWRVAACLYEALLVYDAKDLSLKPGAAESWSISDDQRTYTFKIRPDAKWSNGDPVTAADFLYAFRRALLPDMVAGYTMLFYHIVGAEAFYEWRTRQLTDYVANPAGRSARQLYEQAKARFAETVAVKAPDDRTLVITLARPTSYFLELCAFVTFIPNHRATIDSVTTYDDATGKIDIDAKYWSDPRRLVTNGPYVLSSYEFPRELLMTASDHYWNRAAMGNSAVRERIIEQPETALLSYQNGETDWLPELPSTSSLAADLVAQNRPDVHVVSMAGMYFYNFNCNPKLEGGSPNPLADRRVRQAMSMGIDRKTLVGQVTRLNQPIAATFVPVDAVAGYDPPVEAGIGFDPKHGRELLAEAGYRSGADLKGLSILYNSGHGHEHIAQAIKRMWEQHLGVSVSLEASEGKVFSTRLRSQQFTICRASWFGDYRDPTTWLGKMVTEDGNNDCAYSNPEYDRMLGEAAEELDPAKRFAVLSRAEAVMLQDSPMAMIYQYVNVYVYDPGKVRGLHNNPWNINRLELVSIHR